VIDKNVWQHWLLTERMSELQTLAFQRGNDKAKDVIERARLCLEDGELHHATMFCVAAERALIGRRRVGFTKCSDGVVH
jgi:hypothetical protein